MAARDRKRDGYEAGVGGAGGGGYRERLGVLETGGDR